MLQISEIAMVQRAERCRIQRDIVKTVKQERARINTYYQQYQMHGLMIGSPRSSHSQIFQEQLTRSGLGTGREALRNDPGNNLAIVESHGV